MFQMNLDPNTARQMAELSSYVVDKGFVVNHGTDANEAPSQLTLKA